MDMENAILLAINLGLDCIQFKLYENVDDLIQLSESSDEGEINTEEITVKLEELKKIYGDKIAILGDLKKTKLKKKCWLTPLIVVIDALGDVYACQYYRHRKESHKIGNLLPNKPFEEVWFSERHREVLENIKIEECNKYDCRFHIYNDILEGTIGKDKTFSKFL